MTLDMQPFRLLEFPLSGIRLIEAGAGTGKTYTIAALYLRLLLEAERDIKEILVVTFTQAATEELRDRIRRRIRKALVDLESGDVSGDELLMSLKDAERAKEVLRSALTQMDEAAVFTIHGFCQRMLVENAFESGALFDTDFITDEQDLRRTIIEDFWRRRFYPLDAEETQWIRSLWKCPDELLDDIRNYLIHNELKILPETNPTDVAKAKQIALDWTDRVRTCWEKAQDEITEVLKTDKGLRRTEDTYRSDQLDTVLEALEEYLSDRINSLSLPDRFELFTTEKIQNSLKKNYQTPKHEFFDLCQSFKEAHDRLLRLTKIQILREVIDYFRRELNDRKTNQRVLFFDDLLTNLDQALSGNSGKVLAKRVREQYPVAMIDEFQDTDPLQYRIFSRIYRGCPDCGLFIIGDPKQAIYSFRGADIFTYMQARRDADDQTGRFTLNTNRRSSDRLVAAVNNLFGQAKAPFIYEEDIRFHPTKAADKTETASLLIDGRAPVPLQAWFVQRNEENLWRKIIKKGWAEAKISQACANEVVRLLKLASEGRAVLEGRPLAARDIALLVRNRYEAEVLQEALRGVNVASVYYIRDSVFATNEAAELARLLWAVAEPGNERLLRSALCTEMLGLSANALHELLEDESAWEQRLQEFQEYHRHWQAHGFMNMFHRLLHEQDIPGRLLATETGERRMTNLLQLGELLQAAGREQPGMENLLQWFTDQRAEANGEKEDQQLRLESDEERVKIVTIHKSKGLEYSVVFLPFIWVCQRVDQNRPFIFHDKTYRRPHLDLGSEGRNAHYRSAERERLAEDLRLLYVAFTRAKYLCYFTWGRFKNAEYSALAYLLHQPQVEDGLTPESLNTLASLDDEQICAALELLNQGESKLVEVSPLPIGKRASMATDGSMETRMTARQFAGTIDPSWGIASYTALVSGQYGQMELPDYEGADKTDKPEVASMQRSSIYQFPKGAQAGAFMHSLIEQLDFPTAHGETLQREITRKLALHGFDPGWQPVIEKMVGNLLDIPLDASDGFKLKGLTAGQKRVEMEFYYPLPSPLQPANIDRAIAPFSEYVSGGENLRFSPVHGMMRGYIDLVFEWKERFYLADYKSNHLGNKPEDYAPAQLRSAMFDHRYDLQYLIYAVALHRYLKQRLREYDYGRHFGGVYYFFLRGIDKEKGKEYGLFFDKPDRRLIDTLDDLFAGKGRKRA